MEKQKKKSRSKPEHDSTLNDALINAKTIKSCIKEIYIDQRKKRELKNDMKEKNILENKEPLIKVEDKLKNESLDEKKETLLGPTFKIVENNIVIDQKSFNFLINKPVEKKS